MIDFRKEPFSPVRRSQVAFPSVQPAEPIRGSDILDEHGGMLAQILWESYRNVGDWAVRPRSRRMPSLFGHAAVERRNRQLVSEWIEPELLAPLEVVRDMMAEPRRTDARLVARACMRIAAWAGERGALVTQFYFAAAAGLCVPEDARQAYHAGCLAREIARWDAAEVWLEHALGTARRRRERETQAMAVLGLGNTYYRQGSYRRAREAQGAALALSRKHGLGELQGAAHHGLFVVEAGTDPQRAEAHAQSALEAYGNAPRHVLSLAHDVAYFWIEQGRFAEALPVLRALLPHFHDAPRKRVSVLASLAHAAGERGERRLFADVCEEFWPLAEQPGAEAGLAPALLEVARGAAALAEWQDAVRAAEAALGIARARGEADVVAQAEPSLAAWKCHAEESAPERIPTPPQAAELPGLVTDLVRYLEAGAATA